MSASSRARRLSCLAVGALLAGTLSGCSWFGSDGDTSGSDAVSSDPSYVTEVQTSKMDDPVTATHEYVKVLFTSARDSSQALNVAGSQAVKDIGQENSAALQQSKEGYAKLSALPAEEQKKLAKAYTDADTMSTYYDSEGATDADKVEMSLWMMAVSSMFQAEQDDLTGIIVPESAVSVDGDFAVADLSKVTYDTADHQGTALPITDSGVPMKLHLVKVNGDWRIDTIAQVDEFTGQKVEHSKRSGAEASAQATQKP